MFMENGEEGELKEEKYKQVIYWVLFSSWD